MNNIAAFLPLDIFANPHDLRMVLRQEQIFIDQRLIINSLGQCILQRRRGGAFRQNMIDHIFLETVLLGQGFEMFLRLRAIRGELNDFRKNREP